MSVRSEVDVAPKRGQTHMTQGLITIVKMGRVILGTKGWLHASIPG